MIKYIKANEDEYLDYTITITAKGKKYSFSGQTEADFNTLSDAVEGLCLDGLDDYIEGILEY